MSRPKRWEGEELEKLRKLTERLTFAEIAREYGLSTSAIQMACNRNGIEGKQRNRNIRGAAIPGYQQKHAKKKGSRIQKFYADTPKPDPFARVTQ